VSHLDKFKNNITRFTGYTVRAEYPKFHPNQVQAAREEPIDKINMTRRKEKQAEGIAYRPAAIRAGFSSHGGTKDLALKDVNLGREFLYTWIAVAVTVIATLFLYKDIYGVLRENWQFQSWARLAQDLMFATIFLGLIYGNLVHQLARAGYLHRLKLYLEGKGRFIDAPCPGEKTLPPVAILVPSFKEELRIIRQALVSSALQDYPARRVVLLIDDPPNPTNPDDLLKLEAARNLPGELQRIFNAEAAKYHAAYIGFLARAGEAHLDLPEESRALSRLYEEAANWFRSQAEEHPLEDHTDDLFVSLVYDRPEQALRQRSRNLLRAASAGGLDCQRDELLSGYRHLAGLFAVELASFERKQYVNLSWTSNKAMNLNSYIGLIGKRFNRVLREDGTYLKATISDADLVVPEASFIVTLDADSLLAHDYVSRLVQIMMTPGNERIAVAQTPYTAVPSPRGLLERIAGATTDLQYIVHQGFTQAGATYWVGANAILRKEALDDISIHVQERGFPITKYIQDRTVIEDTESSIDLVVRGWSLYNFPERLSYSATPSDFGSLLIQRRRWANGGLIILPKLLRHLGRTAHRLRTWVEGFMRLSYLTSIAGTNLGLLLILMLPTNEYMSIVWLPLTALPYFWLYGRDMVLAGYRPQDLFRVYALNFMLIPVNLGGVFKSIQQGVTGKQIPFSRTPKVRGRTAAPAGYILAVYALMLLCFSRGLWEVLGGRWLPASFFVGTALVLLYAIAAFIGFRASWEDLSHPLRTWLTRDHEGIALRRALAAASSETQIKPGRRYFWLTITIIIFLILALVLSSVSVGSGAKAVPVLIYHRISSNQTVGDSDLISLNQFAEQMQYLADHGYHTLKVSDLIDFMKGGEVPESSVVLTFDDGWKSVLQAVPLLNRHGFKASFFIITACADGMFGDDYLTWDEISQLAKNPNFEVGSHTVTHPWAPNDNLITWSEARNPGKGILQVRKELQDSKAALESHLARPIEYLAWPKGWYNKELVKLATEAGYKALLTTDDYRANLPGDDVRFIKRFSVERRWDLKTFEKFLRQALSPPGARTSSQFLEKPGPAFPFHSGRVDGDHPLLGRES
jgi:cellulose synthase (UDP-forming)